MADISTERESASSTTSRLEGQSGAGMVVTCQCYMDDVIKCGSKPFIASSCQRLSNFGESEAVLHPCHRHRREVDPVLDGPAPSSVVPLTNSISQESFVSADTQITQYFPRIRLSKVV